MDRSSIDREGARRRVTHVPGDVARLVVYIASAAGAGKTRRLLSDAKRLQASGKRVAIGWLETRRRPDLEHLATGLARIPLRPIEMRECGAAEFDLQAALADRPDVLLLDDLAHDNPPGFTNARRWQDALALRDAGITVIGAFNIAHLDTVAPAAERLTGCTVGAIVPKSFLKAADEVIALDASPELLRRRLESGKLVPAEDVARIAEGAFKEETLIALRELLLRTIDELTIPTLAPASMSTAVAILSEGVDAAMFLHRTAPVVSALDLALEIVPDLQSDRARLEHLAGEYDAELLTPADAQKLDIERIRASMLVVPNGKLAAKLVNARVLRDIFVVDYRQTYLARSAMTTPLSGTIGDRMRIGYGKLTVYLGAAAGAGKTTAMLDRGAQLAADGIDVVIGLVESHGRADTEAMTEGLEQVPRKTMLADGVTQSEMDRDALLQRRPQVALVDELAHTNAPGSAAPKRYLDVLALLRAGINVITTLNVQHLEALNDAVARLTGITVRETLPDGILPLADEVILVDVTPATLLERLHAGKIYPPERIEAALANFFRTENLAALRELALREALRAETRERIAAPFERLMLSIVARPGDLPLVKRASRLAARLEIDFSLVHIAEPNDPLDAAMLAEYARIARTINAEWIDERSDNAAARLLELSRSRSETTIAVGGTLRMPRWPQRKAFARRILEAGARELLVLARPPQELRPSDEGET